MLEDTKIIIAYTATTILIGALGSVFLMMLFTLLVVNRMYRMEWNYDES